MWLLPWPPTDAGRYKAYYNVEWGYTAGTTLHQLLLRSPALDFHLRPVSGAQIILATSRPALPL